MNDQTVICAIATAPGMGAIAVIRLSGKGCIDICDRIFVSPSHKNWWMFFRIQFISERSSTRRN